MFGSLVLAQFWSGIQCASQFSDRAGGHTPNGAALRVQEIIQKHPRSSSPDAATVEATNVFRNPHPTFPSTNVLWSVFSSTMPHMAQPRPRHGATTSTSWRNHIHVMAQPRPRHGATTSTSWRNHVHVMAQPHPRHGATTSTSWRNHVHIMAQPCPRHGATTSTSWRNHVHIMASMLNIQVRMLPSNVQHSTVQ